MSTDPATPAATSSATTTQVTADEHLGLNARLGAAVTRSVGSMRSVYITIVLVAGGPKWSAL